LYASILCVILFASPLSTVALVVATSDSSSIYAPLTLAQAQTAPPAAHTHKHTAASPFRHATLPTRLSSATIHTHSRFLRPTLARGPRCLPLPSCRKSLCLRPRTRLPLSVLSARLYPSLCSHPALQVSPG
jgi:hypothetical protein